MTAKNAKFAITAQSGRSVVKEFTSYAEAQKYADRHFGKGSIVQMVGNSRAATASFKVGDKIKWKDGYYGVMSGYVLKDDGSSYKVSWDGVYRRPTKDMVRITSDVMDVPKTDILNSRACNSQNPVVRNAMNAAGVKGGNYEVTLETVTLKGNSTSSTTMTDAQLKAWLGLIHQNGIYSEAISRFARGEKYYDANIDMHPTVHIRMI